MRLRVFLMSAALLAVPVVPAMAQSYTVLHQFTGQQDGAVPYASPVLDKSGTMYGVTSEGGSVTGSGVIYSASPTGKITTLHLFDGADGSTPYNNALLLDGTTLFGSTSFGGAQDAGVIYSIGTDGSAYTVRYSFSGPDGFWPRGRLVPLHGGLAGITYEGGPNFDASQNRYGDGTIFFLDAQGNLTKLHQFGGTNDGVYPNAILRDANGTLYGSTNQGGGYCGKYPHGGCGVVFRYRPATGEYSILHAFTGDADGADPILGSIGPDGTLYGATQEGKGVTRYGVLFSLSPPGYGFTALATSNNVLGGFASGPSLASNGALVGVTGLALYVYTPGARKVLEYFNSISSGEGPYDQPTIGRDGSIYGITYYGGRKNCVTSSGQSYANGCGLLYKYSPR